MNPPAAGPAGGTANQELLELRALRRVIEGGVTIAGGCYVHGGHPVAGEQAQALVRLRVAGCLVIGPPGPTGHRPVQITPAGESRAAELGRSRD